MDYESCVSLVAGKAEKVSGAMDKLVDVSVTAEHGDCSLVHSDEVVDK